MQTFMTRTRYILLFIIFILLHLNADEIRLIKRGSVYYAPALINNTIRTHFIIDSGAAVVYIPNSMFQKLRASGTIQNSDILGEGYSRIANGDLVRTLFINIRKLKIGNTVLTNVKGGVGGDNASILLGQSALKKLEPWHIDTKHKVFRFGRKTKIHKGYVSASKKINRGEVLTFINYYISLHNHGIPQRTAALYAPQVNYLNHGTIPRKKVLAFKEDFMDQWQQIRFSLLRVIDIKPDSSQPNRTKVVFSVTYKLYSDMEQRGETGQMQIELLLEKRDRTIRIVSEKQKVLSKNRY